MLSTIVSHRYEYRKKEENEQGLILYMLLKRMHIAGKTFFSRLNSKHMTELYEVRRILTTLKQKTLCPYWLKFSLIFHIRYCQAWANVEQQDIFLIGAKKYLKNIYTFTICSNQNFHLPQITISVYVFTCILTHLTTLLLYVN